MFFFYAIDFGINHIVKIKCSNTYYDMLKNVSLEIQKTDKIIFPSTGKHKLSIDTYNAEVAGGIVAGKADSIKWLLDKQTECIEKIFKELNKITWESIIWQLIYRSHKEKFILYKMDFDSSILLNFKV